VNFLNNLLGRTPDAAPERAAAQAISEAVKDAELHICAVEAVNAGLRAELAERQRIYDAAVAARTPTAAALAKAEAAGREAESAFANGSGAEKAITEADRVIRLARIKDDAAREKCEAALRDVQTAQSDLAASDGFVEAAWRACALARNVEAASPASLRAAVAQPCADLLTAVETILRATKTINEAHATSKAAASAAGLPPLDQLHAVLPMLDALAARGIVLADLNALRLKLSSVDGYRESVFNESNPSEFISTLAHILDPSPRYRIRGNSVEHGKRWLDRVRRTRQWRDALATEHEDDARERAQRERDDRATVVRAAPVLKRIHHGESGAMEDAEPIEPYSPTASSDGPLE
jgi:hypothetical protein